MKRIVETSPDRIRARLMTLRPRVLTFLGFSGAGYEAAPAMEAMAGAILDVLDRDQVLVNGGATEAGIGAVYRLARARGFVTTGIVSTRAIVDAVSFAAGLDLVILVPDESWGGVDVTTSLLSPTSQAMVECSDEMIAIGGGAIARDEWLAGEKRGKPVRFLPADSNHQKAIEKAAAQGRASPGQFVGALHEALRDRVQA